jgi:hypothetical protein
MNVKLTNDTPSRDIVPTRPRDRGFMNRKLFLFAMIALIALLLSVAGATAQQAPHSSNAAQAAIGTSFTYQGRLTDGGHPANGLYDFQFALYNALTSTTPIASIISREDISVTNGTFAAELDFGNVFNGDERYLEIGVRPGSSTGAYTTLAPRRALKPVPYALALPGLWTQQNGTSPNLIGGYAGNVISDTVVGGTIGGGGAADGINRVTADWATVGGGWGNQATSINATVGGGSNNQATGGDDTVGGGGSNLATGGNATVGGGQGNLASGGSATVGGGWNNWATDWAATIGGGQNNQASGGSAAIGGGDSNQASGGAATVGGGYYNQATGGFDTIGGGSSNLASGWSATVGGGQNNQATGDGATVGGGQGNQATANDATVGGGWGNQATGGSATVGGGGNNQATGIGATVGGGDNNQASGGSATVGGGYSNQASGDSATVGGGYSNQAISTTATVGGGYSNQATGAFATVGGGYNNQVTNAGATVAGGWNNQATGGRATVGGGSSNLATGWAATVGGGDSNQATGVGATVPGGYGNRAQSWVSFAAGLRAQADHDGAFVWGDNTDADIHSSGPSQFIVRANGGIWLGQATGDLTPTIGTGVFISTSTGAYLSSGGVWTNVSDRNLKENFALVNGAGVLARLAQVPISTWNYRAEDASIRHMGPMAQDFYAAFGLGNNDTSISTVDADGVALAAIQGLYTQNQALAAENVSLREQVGVLKSQNATQQAQIDDLGARVAALEAQAAHGPATSSATQSGLLPGGILLTGIGLVWLVRRRGGGQ